MSEPRIEAVIIDFDDTLCLTEAACFETSLKSGLRQREEFDPHEVDAFMYTFPEVVEAVASLEGRAA